MKLFIQLPLLFLLGMLVPFFAGAQETLDSSFGKNGQLTTEFSSFDDNAHAITVQADGKILVAGQSENGADTDFAIVRYHGDGSLDKDFNNTGQVTVAVGSGDDQALSMVVQEDGKILVAGTTDNGDNLDIAVIRLQTDGLPDMDFNSDGQVVITLPDSDDKAQSILLQEDGKIILAGTSETNKKSQIFLARLNSDGSLDTAFGEQGLAGMPDDANEAALSAVLTSDGHIILAGFKSTGDFSRAAIFSFLEDGQADKNFARDGIALSGTEEENSLFYDLALLGDDKILAAGASVGGSYRSIILAGFAKTGEVDTQFGEEGTVQTDIGMDAVAYSLAVANDGSIYLAGSGSKNEDTDFILLHYSASGQSLDSDPTAVIEEEEEEEATGSLNLSPLEIREGSISGQSFTLTDFSSYDDVARAIYIQDDGTILLAGSADNGKDQDFAVLRYSAEAQAKIRQAGGIYTPQGKYISTIPPTRITRNSAASGGYIQQHTKTPATNVTQRGVCYSITPSPGLKTFSDSQPPPVTTPTATTSAATSSTPSTTGDTTGTTNTATSVADLNPFKVNTLREGCTEDGDGDGEFRSDILNLTPDTTYYIRAYAVLSDSDAETERTRKEFLNSDNNWVIEETVTTTNTVTTTVTITEGIVSGKLVSKTVDKQNTGSFTNGTVIYGNELQFTTDDACFIATAAHGSIDKSQVTILRQFRDSFLKSSTLGKKFIQSYYQLSPPVAELITDNTGLQRGTRILLAPVTLLSYFALHPLFALQLIAMLFVTAALFQLSLARAEYRKPPFKNQGFTLIELLVVLVIIGILAGYVGPRIMGHPEDAKRTMATAQMSSLETALETYKLDNGAYPSTEQGLQALVEAPSVGKLPPKWRKGGYMKKGKVPKDPWGNEYIYLSPGTHNDFDIVSYGSDGESGGEDTDADVNNWDIE